MVVDRPSAGVRHEEVRRWVLREHPSLVAYQAAASPPKHTGCGDIASAYNPQPIRASDLWSRYVADKPLDAVERVAEASEEKSVSTSTTAKDEDKALPPERAFGPAHFPDEQTIRPDHAWNYVASGLTELPADAVRNPSIETRFAEYPRLRRLLELKRQLVDATACPATYLCADLRGTLTTPSRQQQQQVPPTPQTQSAFHLASLMPIKADVVLIDAPLGCYDWHSVPSASNDESSMTWSWDDVAQLPIPLLAAKESFVFLWVGPGCSDGLERGRETLSRWGYRRCEVITWCLTTTPQGNETPRNLSDGGALATSAVHCLVGIRGTVRRSTDTNFVHCNIDTDALFWPGETSTGASTADGPVDLRAKPPELYSLIENFCLGTRRVELFGNNRNIRRGWLTIGHPSALGPTAPRWQEVLAGKNPGSQQTSARERGSLEPEAYNKARFDSFFEVDPVGCPLSERRNVLPWNEAIESLRPRTPPSHHVGPSAPYNPLDSALPPEAIDRSGSNSGPGTTASSSPILAPPFTAHQQANTNLPRGLGAASSSHHDDSGVGSHFPRSALPTRIPPSPRSQRLHPPSSVTSYGPSLNIADNMRTRSPTTGLGAGGPVTVSVQSGSETLSGPQKSAIGLGLGAGASGNAAVAGASSRASGGASSPESKRGRGGGRGNTKRGRGSGI